MKMIKLALLGGAAMAVTAAAAHADDLNALKAQIETLNARVAAMETAPAVPAGYQLMAVSKGEALYIPGLEDARAERAKATIISVMPTADAPAGTTVTINGATWAALVSDNRNYDDSATSDESDLDVISRGQLIVKGVTDTAVGEVGVKLDIRADWRDRAIHGKTGNASAYFDSAWGYWSMTPELTLGGGKAGSIGNVGYGIDGACTCYVTDLADVYMDPGGVSQMRLSYASGPIGVDLAVEDGDRNSQSADSNDLSYAGRISFSSDTFNGSLNGWYLDENNNQIGGGVGVTVDMISLSLGAAMGVTGGQDYTVVSGLAKASVSDEFHLEMGAGYKNYDVDPDVTSVMGGIYYNPVDQLTIGVEAEWADYKDDYTDTTVGLVTVYSF